MIAALEAVVAPGCVGELYSGGEYFRDNDASRAALVAARAALRKARTEP